MSADLNTKIKIKGTNEELFSILKVLQSFSADNVEQNNSCTYIDGACDPSV